MNEVLKQADIDESSLTNVVQVLHFAKNFEDSVDTSDVKLLQLDDQLRGALKEGDCLSFRGERNETIVLCSKDKTYNVRSAETSNSLLLIPEFKFFKEIENCEESENRIEEKVDVAAICHAYYEVTECLPKVNKLLTILEPSSFQGLEFEKTIDKSTLYNWNRLRSEVQASDVQLRNALKEFSIAEFNGYYRMVAFAFEARALTLMLDYMDSNSWGIDEVDKESTFEALRRFIPRSIFDLIFEKYTIPSAKTDCNNEQLYSYHEEKCCKTLGRTLLLSNGTTDYDALMNAWKEAVPEFMEPKEKYLYGIAMIVWNSNKNTKEFVNFPEADLPENVGDRFTALFKRKNKWTVDEITPYISKLASSKLGVNALLTKYTRFSIKDGIKYYSSKHDR